MPRKLTLAMAVVGAALGAALLAAPALAATCQVTTTGEGSQDGSSWTNAATLQGALGNASCTEIWVAAGVYRPTNSTTDRYASFNVGEGVAVYGGFAGTETLRSHADPAVNRTVLSGDIDGNDTTDAYGVTLTATGIAGGNSYHVVVMGGLSIIGGNANIGASTVLDGLTITAGQANGGALQRYGGGLYCNGSYNSCSPTIRRSIFSGNSASLYGGAIYNNAYAGASSPTISHSTFSGNSAQQSGGAIFNNGHSGGTSSPIISQSTFSGNSAPTGGAIYNYSISSGTSSPTISDSTFSGNSAPFSGGAIYSNGYSGGSGAATNSPTVERSVLWGNTAGGGGGPQAWTVDSAYITFVDSLIQGGCANGGDGGGTCTGLLVTSDPQLGPLQDNGGPTPTMLHGTIGGAVDAVACPASPGTDQRGVTRPQGALCDLGAVERIPSSNNLAVTVTGAGTVAGGGGACASTSTSCTASYDNPALVLQLAATPSANHTFTGWGGDCSGTGACTVTMNQARSVTAAFALNTYAITASASPTAGGSVTCASTTVNHGSGTTCTASAPNVGFTFTRWTGCDSTSGTTCTLSNITGSRAVLAEYQAITTINGTTQPTTGTGGAASASIDTGGGPLCRFDTTATGYMAATPPPGRQAPQGALNFKLIGCTPGATVRVTTTWPQPVADFTKRSQGAFLPASHFTISGNTVSFDVTDGGLGDDDGLTDGVITDPAMPLAAALATTAIPTLSEWGLLWLAVALMLLAWRMHGDDRFLPHCS